MSSRKIILLFMALLVGVGTFIAFRSSQTPPPAQAPVVETTQVLAAARDLPTGTILKESDMKWIPWAATAETSKLYVKGKTEMSTLVGAVAREGMRGDEPILAGHVVQPHEQGFLAAVLTPGMRAVSITLSPSAEVAGFIFPGDRVDVILTHTFSRKNLSTLTERHVSETVVTNARILALDQKSDNQSTDPKVAQLATLEVTSQQAEKLILAADLVGAQGGNHGILSLALRSLAADTDKPAMPAANDAGTPNAAAPDSAPPVWDSDVSQAYPAVNGDDGLMQKVQIMRGKDMTETTFERRH